MAYENFTTGWTETDPNGHLTQTATRSTWNGALLNESAWLLRTAGVNFTADWDIAFDFRIDSGSTNTDTSPEILSMYAADNNSGILLYLGDYDGSKLLTKIFIWDSVGGDEYSVDTTTLLVNTVYYARYRRLEAVGTYGTMYLDIYPTDADRIAGTNVSLALSKAISVMGKEDMTQLGCPWGGTYSNANTFSAYLENLDLTYTPAGGATSTTGEKYPTSATTSATGAHIDDDFVRTAAIMTAGAGTTDAACITATSFDAGDQTYILKATNFDFSGILAGSQINGVICRFEGWANTSGATAVSVACDLAQLLNTSRAETGENIVSSGLWTTVFLSATTGIVSLGNSANLWSCALTADWVKNANFGVALGFITGVANTDVFIDYVTLEIVYTPPAAVAALSLMYHFIEC
jgi:hypothetical protein